ncbi:hypothetical protein EPI10_006937 [Gossypium australe]|uniref:Uncharacterized protein n=1 Tax=Gossypium australe TaxID=47621 RepID=A0A5B6WTR0_9ROSI|nr:hypothetical protein EPI10_006937 [Gossypium australe]
MQPQCSYIGIMEKIQEMNPQKEDENAMVQRVQDNLQSIAAEKVTKMQEEGATVEEKVNGRNTSREKTLKPVRKTSWKRFDSAKVMSHYSEESILRKRKSTEIEVEDCCTEETREDEAKRKKHDGQGVEGSRGGIYLAWKEEITIFEKLERLQISLIRWASSIKKGRDGLKSKLTKELENLMERERDDDTMAKLIDTRIRLNMEIDKDEMYWEQRARAN